MQIRAVLRPFLNSTKISKKIIGMVKAELNYLSLAYLALSLTECVRSRETTLKPIHFFSLFPKTIVRLLLPQSAISEGFIGP